MLRLVDTVSFPLFHNALVSLDEGRCTLDFPIDFIFYVVLVGQDVFEIESTQRPDAASVSCVRELRSLSTSLLHFLEHA
jgi:hypothetical protein